MIGNSPGISKVELWPCKDTFPTFLHGEVVAAVNKMLTDKCITCQKISGHVIAMDRVKGLETLQYRSIRDR